MKKTHLLPLIFLYTALSFLASACQPSHGPVQKPTDTPYQTPAAAIRTLIANKVQGGAPPSSYATETPTPTAIDATPTPFATLALPPGPDSAFVYNLLPSGDYLVTAGYRETGSGYACSYYFYTTDGTRAVQVDLDSCGVFSPDGRMLVLSRGEPPENNLFLYDLSNGMEALIDNSRGCTNPAWSPDGSAVVAACDTGKIEVLSIIANIRIPVEAFSKEDSNWGYPSWSPDGRWIASINISTNSVYLIGSGCIGNPKICQHLTLGPFFEKASNPLVAWSPDGRQMLAAYQNLGEDSYNVFTYNLQSGVKHMLVKIPRREGLPAWSPDGKWIAYSLSGVIYLISPQGGQPALLTQEAGDVVTWVHVGPNSASQLAKTTR